MSQVIDNQLQPKADAVAFDFSKLNWIDGGAITSLSNLVEWLKKRNVQIGFQQASTLKEGVKYLDDCGFFKQYVGRNLSPAASLRDTTIPLNLVDHSRSRSWIDYEVIPWLASKLDLSAESFAELAGGMYEIFNNIIDHAAEQIGCSFIQWHPKLEIITVSISDFGIGIPNSMRVAFPSISDQQAVEQAVIYGVTSKRGGRNLGIGLSDLVDLVARNSGILEISSCFGRLVNRATNQGRTTNALQTKYYYPGTLIQITLSTRTLRNVETKRGEVEW